MGCDLCLKYKYWFLRSCIYILLTNHGHSITMLIIANIAPTLHVITPIVHAVFEECNYDKKFIQQCIEWCINEALFNVLLLSVVNSTKHHIYEVVYSRISFVIETHIRSIVDFREVFVFKDNQVKTKFVNQAIYITTHHEHDPKQY